MSICRCCQKEVNPLLLVEGVKEDIMGDGPLITPCCRRCYESPCTPLHAHCHDCGSGGGGRYALLCRVHQRPIEEVIA